MKKKTSKSRKGLRRKPRVTPEQKGLQVLIAAALNRETPPTAESVHRAIREERLAERLGEDTIQFIAGVNELVAPPQGAPKPAVVSQQIRNESGAPLRVPQMAIVAPQESPLQRRMRIWLEQLKHRPFRDVPIRRYDYSTGETS
jgi:hypothetical protein